MLTSSCAAIYGDAVDLEKTPNGVFTEDIWNTSSSLSHQAYSYSKTMAEKAAWEIHDGQDQWKLVVVNPSFVLGPGINPFGSGESQSMVRQMGDGTFKSGVPDMKIGVIDVRDLAEAHVRAAFVEDAKGRHIISGHDSGMLELAGGLKKFRDQYPVPKGKLPKALIWLIGPFVNKAFTRKVVARNIGHPWRADNSKSKSELGMSYRPLEDTIQEAFQQMVDTGQLKAAK